MPRFWIYQGSRVLRFIKKTLHQIWLTGFRIFFRFEYRKVLNIPRLHKTLKKTRLSLKTHACYPRKHASPLAHWHATHASMPPTLACHPRQNATHATHPSTSRMQACHPRQDATMQACQPHYPISTNSTPFLKFKFVLLSFNSNGKYLEASNLTVSSSDIFFKVFLFNHKIIQRIS